MAIYHFSASIIGRNSGRSSVAAAAYRAGEDLINEYDGVEHDFTKKNWVEYTEIILPENAPKEYQNRSTLWNAVELVEKTKDAQLAREFEIALPVEMSREEQLELIHAFVYENLVSKGMCVDIAIHNPPLMNDRHQPIDKNGNVTKNPADMIFINPHAHVMVTVRPMDEQGNWEKKSQIEYICRRGEEEAALTSEEFKVAKDSGWEKIYKYRINEKTTVWLTPSKAEEQGLLQARVSKQPKTSSFGRKNKTVEAWNSKERILEWRLSWEQIVNNKFADMGSDIRIDSRSFVEQGREDEIPTTHMGPAATMMDKRADREVKEGKLESEVIRSDIGEINRQIKEHNSFVRELKKALANMVKKAKDFISETAKKLESKRAELIGNAYETAVLTREFNQMELSLLTEEEKIKKYENVAEQVEKANKSSIKLIEQYRKELERCKPLQISKKKELQMKIRDEQDKMESRSDYLSNMQAMCGFSSKSEVQEVTSAHKKKESIQEKLGETIKVLRESSEKNVAEYKAIIEAISDDDKKELAILRSENRPEFEEVAKTALKKKLGNGFSKEEFEEELRRTDAMLKDIDNPTEGQLKKGSHRIR